MAAYDPRPKAPPDLDLAERIRNLEVQVGRMQGQIEREDTFLPCSAAFNLTSVCYANSNSAYFTIGYCLFGYCGGDVLDIRHYATPISGTSAHTWKVTESDAFLDLVDSDRGSGAVAGWHRLLWWHPYQTHPDDNRFRPGSTTLLRIAPPDTLYFSAKVATGGTASWAFWAPLIRVTGLEALPTATTAGVFSYA